MSIKLGKNQLNNLNNNSTLILNSYNESNLILLNSEENTSSNVFINFKNSILTGVSSNNYIIKEIDFDKTLFSINTSNSELFTNLYVKNNLKVSNTIETSNDSTHINKSLTISLLSSNDNFILQNSDIELININSNSHIKFKTRDLNITDTNNNDLFDINTLNTSIYNNLYIRNGTIYTSNISALPGTLLQLNNVKYNSTTVDNFNIINGLKINNNSLSSNIAIEIFKYYNNCNIVSINTCNLNNTISNNFIINKNGLIGIGTNYPNASLDIYNTSDNILKYNGLYSGDCFNLNKRGDIGIGITQPRAQLHIKRSDDLYNINEFRRTPLIKLDISYDPFSNISNIYTNKNTYYTENLIIGIKTTSNIENNSKIYYNNSFYLLNNAILSDETMNSNINNISNIVFNNIGNIIKTSEPNNNVTITNNFIFPSSNTSIILDILDNGYYFNETTSKYEINYTILIMTPTTYSTGGYIYDKTNINFNASNFTGYSVDINNIPNNTTIDKFDKIFGSYLNNNYSCKIGVIIEKNTVNINSRYVSYNIPYTTINREKINCPDFISISSNNNFVSSISSYGTLSLGHEIPVNLSNQYLLYAPGNVLFDTIYINKINTVPNQIDISFNQKNIKDVGSINCQTLNAQNIDMTNIPLSGTNINMINGNFSNLSTSNLQFYNAYNDYISFSNLNVNLATTLSVGRNKYFDKNASLNITVNNNILENNYLGFYKNNNAIKIINDTNTNPSLLIQTNNVSSIPYIILNNSSCGYYFRIINDTYKSCFQISTNNIQSGTNRESYFKNNNTYNKSPHIIQHIKEYNTLTFGENDIICIDCETKNYNVYDNTNSSTKISIGIPYQLYSTEITPDEHVDYFHNNIKTLSNPYFLNIYGNVKIANINNDPVITCKTDNNNKVYTAINGEPDLVNECRIYGTMCSSNIKTYNNIMSSNIDTRGLNIFIPSRNEYVSLLDIIINNNLLNYLL